MHIPFSAKCEKIQFEMKINSKRVVRKFYLNGKWWNVFIIIPNMDSLSIICDAIRSTFQNNHKYQARSASTTRKYVSEQIEQLNFVAGVLHNAILFFFRKNSTKKIESKQKKILLKNPVDGWNLHSHAIYLAGTSSHFSLSKIAANVFVPF